MSTTICIIKKINDIYRFKKYVKDAYASLDKLTYNKSTDYTVLSFVEAFNDVDKGYLVNHIHNYMNSVENDIVENTYKKIHVINSHIISGCSLTFETTNIFVYKGIKSYNMLRSVRIYSKLNEAYVDESLLPDFTYEIQVLDFTSNIVLGNCILNNKTNNINTVDIDTSLLKEDETIVHLQIKKGVLGVDYEISYVELVYY